MGKRRDCFGENIGDNARTSGESCFRRIGKNAYLEGYSIGGKTATSQTLPRSAGKYISSFIGFAPADDPQILGMVIIHDPQGIYYGGTIAAPVLRDIYDNVLPYLGIEKSNGWFILYEIKEMKRWIYE